MKNRINLLNQRQKKALPPILIFFTGVGKKIIVFTGIIFFVLFIIANYFIFKQKQEIAKLEETKKEYLNYLINNSETEAKLRYFKAKEKQVTDFYKDDAIFLPYYQMLMNALNYASSSASVASSESVILQSVVIDKERKSNFIIKLVNFDTAINFLKYVESESFLSNFDELILTNFNLFETNQSQETQNYQFSFRGVFKKINGIL